MSAERSGVVDLDGRYGRTPARRRGRRVIAILAGAAVLVVTLAWALWVGLLGPSNDLEYRDVGYSGVTEDAITVRWDLTVPTGRAARCAVQALDDNRGVVGWKIVDLPASERRTRQFSEELRTTQRPVTGLIYRCWLA